MRLYRFVRINAPAAIARMFMPAARPSKLTLNNDTTPVKISQMLSKNKPVFEASFMEELPFERVE
jgi:hypothetical protein